MKRYAYIPKRICDLSDTDAPSAGPYPNVAGMRNKYWGHNAIIARQGAYIYNLTHYPHIIAMCHPYFK